MKAEANNTDRGGRWFTARYHCGKVCKNIRGSQDTPEHVYVWSSSVSSQEAAHRAKDVFAPESHLIPDSDSRD